MKTYLIIFSVLACVACNNTQKAEERGREAANRENAIRQRAIDSMAEVNARHQHSSTASPASTTNNEVNNTTAEPERKGMSKTTKGALIGTGVGIVSGAATGAAVSKDKGKGAVVGGIVGGGVGSGVGYGIGANEDRKDKKKSGK
jgi:hypothetical protein